MELYIIRPTRSHWVNRFEPVNIRTEPRPDAGCQFCDIPEGEMHEHTVYNSSYRYYSCSKAACNEKATGLTSSINRKIVATAYEVVMNLRVPEEKQYMTISHFGEKFDIDCYEENSLFQMMEQQGIDREDFGDMGHISAQLRAQCQENQEILKNQADLPILPEELWNIITEINEQEFSQMDTPKLLDKIDITVVYRDDYDPYDAHEVTEEDFDVIINGTRVDDESPVTIYTGYDSYEDMHVIQYVT